MSERLWTVILLCAMLSGGCREAVDTGPETTGGSDAGTAADDGAGGAEGGGVVPGGGSGAQGDGGTTPVTPPSHGQCGFDADCAPGLVCQPRPPGGICNGCSADADCPRRGGYAHRCNANGACSQVCRADTDCARGLRCSATGLCVMAACDACPAPYVCDGRLCVRRPCDATCPTGRCSGDFCVDDL